MFSLHTNRLTLHQVQESDIEDIHMLLSIPAVDQYNALGIPTNIEVTQVYLDEWIENLKMRQEFVFSIREKQENNFIGLFSLRIGTSKYKIGTIWYKLHPKYWSQGYATEAAYKVLQFGFENMNLHRIEAGCAIDNIGSIRVLEKIGMQREGCKRKILPLLSGWSDAYQYAMLEKEWEVSINR